MENTGEMDESNPEGFIEKQPFGVTFESIKIIDGEFVTFMDCRMTSTTEDESNEIRDAFKLGKDTKIMTLYLKGNVWEHPMAPEIQTAKGYCAYFVYNLSEHDPLIKKNELRIKKEAACYYEYLSESDYKKTPFGELTNVIKSFDDLGGTSSPRTTHRPDTNLIGK